MAPSFYEICGESRYRAFNGVCHAYEFMIDPFYLQAQEQRPPRDEWTRGLNSAKPLSISVQLKAGISEDGLERFGKACQDSGKKKEYTIWLPMA